MYKHTHTHTGLGTGIAPLVGFLAHRRALRNMGTPVGPAYLFVGCRDVYSDFLYKDELLDLLIGVCVYIYMCVCVCVVCEQIVFVVCVCVCFYVRMHVLMSDMDELLQVFTDVLYTC